MSVVTPETVVASLSKPSTVPLAGNSNWKPAKIDSLVRAARKAAECLRNEGDVRRAQCYLPPQQWEALKSAEKSLRRFMTPMLHGNRYSPYGRHFTQDSKLEVITGKLQYYVESGDMVVDFCCGSNLFSRLMSQKLSEAGKICLFKNYDIIQPKDVFNFERKDFMTVQKEELFQGDKLITGLNPPFGVNGQLASAFSKHCASFRPKIVILIVPGTSRRLEDFGYELIWQDCDLLKGESFYLPGSVDSEGNSLNQLNHIPPVLYLWSRLDWATKHRSIALEHGHLQSGPDRDVLERMQHDLNGGVREQEMHGQYGRHDSDATEKRVSCPVNLEERKPSKIDLPTGPDLNVLERLQQDLNGGGREQETYRHDFEAEAEAEQKVSCPIKRAPSKTDLPTKISEPSPVEQEEGEMELESGDDGSLSNERVETVVNPKMASERPDSNGHGDGTTEPIQTEKTVREGSSGPDEAVDRFLAESDEKQQKATDPKPRTQKSTKQDSTSSEKTRKTKQSSGEKDSRRRPSYRPSAPRHRKRSRSRSRPRRSRSPSERFKRAQGRSRSSPSPGRRLSLSRSPSERFRPRGRSRSPSPFEKFLRARARARSASSPSPDRRSDSPLERSKQGRGPGKAVLGPAPGFESYHLTPAPGFPPDRHYPPPPPLPPPPPFGYPPPPNVGYPNAPPDAHWSPPPPPNVCYGPPLPNGLPPPPPPPANTPLLPLPPGFLFPPPPRFSPQFLQPYQSRPMYW